MVSVLTFLGNPGRHYSATRHNFGRRVCETFTGEEPPVWTEKFHGRWAEVRLSGRRIILQEPMTWMNDCGRSVQALLHFFKIPAEELLVIHDDLELSFGTLLLKKGGGTSGHNGLRSLQKYLGTDSFGRLRLGIGRPRGIPVSTYVLSRFSPEEEAELPALCLQAKDLILKEIASP